MKMRTTMCVVPVLAMLVLSLALVSCSSSPMSKSEKEEHRTSTKAMASEALSQLYAKHPDAKDVIEKATGYAVFSDFGFKVWTLGGAGGSGVAIDNATKQATFMSMHEFEPGMGLGASDFRLVFVLESQEAFDKFVAAGWEFGTNAMATAKTKTAGGSAAGAVTLSDGVKMYQLDQDGLIVGVSLTAVKFSKNSELN